jgi:glyoxylase-like metal-dependent hydrolase (beta-lactamase superfamily II)
VLTHGHFDHGSAGRDLADEWNIPMYVHPLESPYLTEKKEYPDPGFLASLAQHSATVTSDLEFFLCGDNLDLVGGKAKELETVGG